MRTQQNYNKCFLVAGKIEWMNNKLLHADFGSEKVNAYFIVILLFNNAS